MASCMIVGKSICVLVHLPTVSGENPDRNTKEQQTTISYHLS
jgi:hypothetical protein